jgi:hypothetical protein
MVVIALKNAFVVIVQVYGLLFCRISLDMFCQKVGRIRAESPDSLFPGEELCHLVDRPATGHDYFSLVRMLAYDNVYWRILYLLVWDFMIRHYQEAMTAVTPKRSDAGACPWRGLKAHEHAQCAYLAPCSLSTPGICLSAGGAVVGVGSSVRRAAAEMGVACVDLQAVLPQNSTKKLDGVFFVIQFDLSGSAQIEAGSTIAFNRELLGPGEKARIEHGDVVGVFSPAATVCAQYTFSSGRFLGPSEAEQKLAFSSRPEFRTTIALEFEVFCAATWSAVLPVTMFLLVWLLHSYFVALLSNLGMTKEAWLNNATMIYRKKKVRRAVRTLMVSDENIHFLLLAAGCATALFLMVGALALQLFLLWKGVQKQRQLCKARQENDKAERNLHNRTPTELASAGPGDISLPPSFVASHSLADELNEKECSICLDPMKGKQIITLFPCLHSFCDCCFRQHSEVKDKQGEAVLCPFHCEVHEIRPVFWGAGPILEASGRLLPTIILEASGKTVCEFTTKVGRMVQLLCCVETKRLSKDILPYLKDACVAATRATPPAACDIFSALRILESLMGLIPCAVDVRFILQTELSVLQACFPPASGISGRDSDRVVLSGYLSRHSLVLREFIRKFVICPSDGAAAHLCIATLSRVTNDRNEDPLRGVPIVDFALCANKDPLRGMSKHLDHLDALSRHSAEYAASIFHAAPFGMLLFLDGWFVKLQYAVLLLRGCVAVCIRFVAQLLFV